MNKTRACVLLVTWVLTDTAPAFGLDPSRHVSQYGHRTWSTSEGFLPGRLATVVQTADGYLWVGGANGLFRFDGNRFVPWRSQRDEALPAPQINTLTSARDGSLWIGTMRGLARLKDGRLTTFPTAPGVIGSVLEARDSTIWFTKLLAGEPTPLCHVFNENVRCYRVHESGPILSGNHSLVEDDLGRLWIGGDTALIQWTPASQHAFRPLALQSNSNIEGIYALASASDDTMWVGVARPGKDLGLARVVAGRWLSFVAPGLDGSTLAVTSLLVDRTGTLWVGTVDRGAYRIRGNEVEHFGRAEGLSGDLVWSFFEDREGTLWIATNAGLDSLRDVEVASFSRQTGLSSAEIDSVVPSRDGGIWIGEAGALDHLRARVVTAVKAGGALPGQQVAALFEDHAGELWVGVDDKLFAYNGQQFRGLTRRDGTPTGQVLGLVEDRDGVMWAEVAGTPRSLLEIRNHQVQAEYPAPQTPSARRVAKDPRGGLWLGLNNGDLAHFDRGTITTFPFDHGAGGVGAGPWVFQLLPIGDDSVLAATSYGVIGRHGQRSITLTVRNGLPCNPTYGLATGPSASLWLYSECGLVEIPRQEFEKWWTNGSTSVAVHVLDAYDGARPAWMPFGSAAASADGKLWFTNGEELQMIDARAARPRNRVAPPVYIEDVIADRKSYTPVDGVSLPALTRDIEIDFTALSYRAPQKVRFRYRLDGRDVDWQDTARRQAVYTDLRPGAYRFRVIAGNEDGLWNDAGAQLAFAIAPAWYQTTLAKSAAIGGMAALAWLIYRRRVRHATAAIAARFDERLIERTRIAQDLHDTFLQTLQGSKLVVDDALDPSTDAAHMRRALERLSIWIGDAMHQGRAALNSLRGSIVQTNDLAEALRLVATSDLRHPSTAVKVSVDGTACDLHPIVRDEVYAIASEALRNALRHSGAREVIVKITYSRDLTIHVVDNGVGIDTATLESGRDGHFGLKGMRERATRIRAKLTISTPAGGGTDLQLVVPRSFVFKDAKTRRNWIPSPNPDRVRTASRTSRNPGSTP